jgi:hypothetical protein
VQQEGGAAEEAELVAAEAAVAAGEVRDAAVCPGEDLLPGGRLRLEAGPVGSVEAAAATGLQSCTKESYISEKKCAHPC